MKEMLKPLAALLANVSVLTALLVYFGWVRAEAHAAGLGIDESLLGMSVREYVLRSVGPVLVMAVAVCVGGLLWLAVEPHLRGLVQAPGSGQDTQHTWWRPLPAWALALAWLWLPLLVRVLGERRPVLATILFPAAIGVGILLWSWTRSVRGPPGAGRHGTAASALVWFLVVVCLFWTATTYAQDLGRRLSEGFGASVLRAPAVVVYSTSRLHLDGPGVVEQTLPSPDADTYRYSGLRFVEHTGGNYFLVSDGWSPTYGVFFILPDDASGTRFELVRGTPP